MTILEFVSDVIIAGLNIITDLLNPNDYDYEDDGFILYGTDEHGKPFTLWVMEEN